MKKENYMKTKLEIIQKLLDERKVTAEEAMVLMQVEKEYIYVPQQYYPQWQFYQPFTPYYGSTSSGELTVNCSQTSFN